MEGITAVCHAFQMQSSQQQNQNSARSTCGKQCKAPLNLTLKNQVNISLYSCSTPSYYANIHRNFVLKLLFSDI